MVLRQSRKNRTHIPIHVLPSHSVYSFSSIICSSKLACVLNKRLKQASKQASEFSENHTWRSPTVLEKKREPKQYLTNPSHEHIPSVDRAVPANRRDSDVVMTRSIFHVPLPISCPSFSSLPRINTRSSFFLPFCWRFSFLPSLLSI